MKIAALSKKKKNLSISSQNSNRSIAAGKSLDSSKNKSGMDEAVEKT